LHPNPGAEVVSLTRRRPPFRNSQLSLQNDRDPLPDADAHGRQPPAAAPLPELPGQADQETGTGTAERVSDGDGPTSGIDDARVEVVPFGQAGEGLGRERLVELDNGEVGPADARPLESLVGRLDGTDPVQLWLDRADRPAGHPGQRRRADRGEAM
jgi:hypothetical protein